MYDYLFVAVSYLFLSRANIGLVQFVLSGGKHVQALRLADEKIVRQSQFRLAC